MSQVNFKIDFLKMILLMSMLLQQTQTAPSYDQYPRNSPYASFVLSILPATALYLDQRTLTCDLLVNLQVSLDCEDNLKVYNTS